MNERINKLAEQAFLEYESVYKYGANIPKEFTEKFAELIIKECILLSYDEATRFYNMDEDELASVMENFGELLKKHFGLMK